MTSLRSASNGTLEPVSTDTKISNVQSEHEVMQQVFATIMKIIGIRRAQLIGASFDRENGINIVYSPLEQPNKRIPIYATSYKAVNSSEADQMRFLFDRLYTNKLPFSDITEQRLAELVRY